MCLYNGKNLCWNILQAWNEVNEGNLHLAAKSWTTKPQKTGLGGAGNFSVEQELRAPTSLAAAV